MIAHKGLKILEILKELYPNPGSELNFKNEFELLCAVLLSAQCTDKKVNQVTSELFAKYPNFAALSKAEISDVERIIREVNYYKTKSKHLIAMCQRVMTEFGGAIPRSHAALTTLAGVGSKTANVVLSELKIEPRLAVDTHVFRVSRRLGLTRGANVRKVEESLTRTFPPETWRSLHHGLILHGRRVCKAQTPNCAECPLRPVCNFGMRKRRNQLI